jgi:hypothetical protein
MRVCFPATHKKMQAQSKDLEKHFESLSHWGQDGHEGLEGLLEISKED